MTTKTVKDIRFDIYRALDQVMVKVSNLRTGDVGLGTGKTEREAKTKALRKLWLGMVQ